MKLPLDISKNKETNFLIDTGSQISLIKEKILKENAQINEDEQIKFKSVHGSEKTIGTQCGNFKLKSEMPCKFHIVSNKTNIPQDGLLGNDFLLRNCSIDGPNKRLIFPNTERNETEFSVPFLTANDISKNSKILVNGSNCPLGDGVETQRVTRSPVASCSTKNSIKETLAGESGEQQLRVDCDQAQREVHIPPRTETFIKISCEHTDDLLCLAQELSPGVLIPNCLVQPKDNKVIIGIMNINEEGKSFDKIEPIFSKLNKFDILDLKKKEIQDNNRVRCMRLNENKERMDRLYQEVKLSPDLNVEEKLSLENIFYDFNDIFHLKGDRLTNTTVLTHQININKEQGAINQKMYRLPASQKEIINQQVQEMLDNDIISPSKSPWNSPLLVVSKKAGEDGTKRWRVVVDFRKLNEVTVKDAFPLPRIEDILDQLGNSRYFTTLDLASGYHQVLVDKKDREKTAFSTDYNHYEFKRMPFGLTGAPATFQRIMNNVLAGLQGFKCFVYLDDVVIYGRNLEDHNSKLLQVFERLRENNLKLQPEKCRFLQREVIYLGHKCTENEAFPDPSKTQCVFNFPIPKTVRQVQSFLGLANYYRKFIPNFSKTASPINKLLRKNVKFKWTEECEKAFQSLKDALVNPPLLIYPDFSNPFNLTTDASNEALGAVLSQGEVGRDKPIAYASRILNAAERKYSTIEKELLAIVWATKTFRCYLLGRKFTVFTDHQPLKGVFKVKDPTSRLIRFHVKLSEFDYTIEYKPGKFNTNADALSRISERESNIPEPKCLAITRAQAKETEEKLLEDNIETQDKLSQENNDNDFLDKMDLEGILSDASIKFNKENVKILEDPEEIKIILNDYHDAPLGGHQGVWKTFNKVRRNFKWKGMMADITKYIQKCPKCQRNKAGKPNKMQMKITDTADKPFDKVYMDIVGPLEETVNGNKYILTFEDDLTRFMDCYAISNTEASTVARKFFEEIITRYRIPKRLVTDQGANFTSDVFTKTCKLLKIKKLQTTAYHPQANGALERSHGPLAQYLRSYVEENPQTWDEHLRAAMFVRNNSIHRSTKLTPMDCLFGFTAEIPSSLKREPEPVYNHEKYYYMLKNNLQKVYKLAKENLQKAKEQTKTYYDRNIRPVSFSIGNKVLLKNAAKKGKLSPEWTGPYDVIDVPSDVNTVIQIGKKKRRVHNNRLKHFYD